MDYFHGSHGSFHLKSFFDALMPTRHLNSETRPASSSQQLMLIDQWNCWNCGPIHRNNCGMSNWSHSDGDILPTVGDMTRTTDTLVTRLVALQQWRPSAVGNSPTAIPYGVTAIVFSNGVTIKVTVSFRRSYLAITYHRQKSLITTNGYC